jgi:hypothetical protein
MAMILSILLIPVSLQAAVDKREDFTRYIRGSNWSPDKSLPAVFCDPGTFVTGLSLAIEKVSKAKGMNLIRDIAMLCGSFENNAYHTIFANTDLPMSDNSWSETARCPDTSGSDSHAIGIKSYDGAPFGGVSMASYFAISCNDDNMTTLETDNEKDVKKSNARSAMCKVNEAICGMKLGIKDTAPGAIALMDIACCSIAP